MEKVRPIKSLPPIEQLRSRTLGRVLIKMGVLTREQVHECLRVQKQQRKGAQIGQIFLEMGLVDENQLRIALAAQRAMEYVNLDAIDVPEEVIEKIPAQMAKSYRVVPIEYDKEKNELTIVLDNPNKAVPRNPAIDL